MWCDGARLRAPSSGTREYIGLALCGQFAPQFAPQRGTSAPSDAPAAQAASLPQRVEARKTAHNL